MTTRLAALMVSGALLATVIAGCGKKSEGGGEAASGGSIGVTECDDYLKAVEACSAKASPENKAAMEASMKANRDAWKDVSKSASGKEALKAGCKAAHDTFLTANPGCK